MRNPTGAICGAVLLAFPIPAGAQDARTAFDGSYAGVSRTLEEGGMLTHRTARCPQSGAAAPLTIANGTARTPWNPDDPLVGPVDLQGGIVMRTQHGQKFEGRIDAQGRVTGRVTGVCAYQMVWQKRVSSTRPAR